VILTAAAARTGVAEEAVGDHVARMNVGRLRQSQMPCEPWAGANVPWLPQLAGGAVLADANQRR
jgi:hypothetical protein